MREMKTKSLLISSPAILVACLCLAALNIINTLPVNTDYIALKLQINKTQSADRLKSAMVKEWENTNIQTDDQ